MLAEAQITPEISVFTHIKRNCSTAVGFRSLYLEVRRAVPRGGTCTVGAPAEPGQRGLSADFLAETLITPDISG